MKWTTEKINKLVELYPNHTNKDISEILEVSINGVKKKARKLRIFKTKEHKAKLVKARTRDLSYENLNKIAKKFKTKYDFQKNDSSAYSAAGVMGIKDEVCDHMIPQNISRPQLILKYFIGKLFNKDILYNTRQIIKPYELDIYVPYYKLAFEYDGTHWHKNKEKIDTIKNKKCAENGIILFRITDSNCYYRYYIGNIKKSIIEILIEINKHCGTNIKENEINDIKDIDVYSFINDSILDYDDIEKITNKYFNYKEFKTIEKSLYCKLISIGCLRQFTTHMYKDIIYWNVELCKNEINKYNTFKDFYTNSYKCYIHIQRNNLYYLLGNFENYPKRLKNKVNNSKLNQ
jgi:very-short-patch-repair endonuclease